VTPVAIGSIATLVANDLRLHLLTFLCCVDLFSLGGVDTGMPI
jgi:hypothetical protein